ncbi:MAG: hypothetical protein K0S56_3140 [Microvirga sp.]|jgi:hypothetical protein|nr:hypothetical protein [Microvirga sp.]
MQEIGCLLGFAIEICVDGGFQDRVAEEQARASLGSANSALSSGRQSIALRQSAGFTCPTAMLRMYFANSNLRLCAVIKSPSSGCGW